MNTIYDALFNNYSIIQLIVAIIALFFWNTFKQLEYRLYIVSLWFIVFVEVFALYYGRHVSEIGYNKIVFNIRNIINFYFLFWLFYRFSESYNFKKTISVLGVLYAISLMYEIGFEKINPFQQPQVKSFILAGFSVMLCVFYYFFEMLNSSRIVNIYRDLFFWIAVSLFVYYLVFTPFKIGETNFFKLEDYFYLFYIKQAITIFSSLILITGFIVCSKRKV